MSDAATAAITALVSRLEKVTQRIEAIEKQLANAPPQQSSSSASSGGASSASVQDYEDLVNQFIKPFVDLSKNIAPEVAAQAELVLKAVNAQRDFLHVAANCKKPADAVLQQLVKPTADAMSQIVEVKEKERKTKFPNHLSTVSEGIAALGWVLVSPTPGPHVADMRGGSEFYSNRILKEFKGKDQAQVDWVASYNNFLKELQTYIKKHHTTGVTWNPKGEDASSFSASSSQSSSDSGAPPPPPPVLDSAPIAVSEQKQQSSDKQGPDMSAIFNQLNQGEGITSGLKKVTKDMKTKNRTDKTSVVPAKESKIVESKKTSAPAKPPKFGLEGNKWNVEFQVSNKNIVIDQTEVKQTVYIYKCKDSVIQIKGKVNAVTLDDCVKTAVVFENIVASFEVVNCQSVEVQMIGKVPSFAVDKTSGCQIYLSKDALDIEIVTSKSSEMNVMFPDATGELLESPIPEQYKSVVKNGKLLTETVQHV